MTYEKLENLMELAKIRQLQIGLPIDIIVLEMFEDYFPDDYWKCIDELEMIEQAFLGPSDTLMDAQKTAKQELSKFLDLIIKNKPKNVSGKTKVLHILKKHLEDTLKFPLTQKHLPGIKPESQEEINQRVAELKKILLERAKASRAKAGVNK